MCVVRAAAVLLLAGIAVAGLAACTTSGPPPPGAERSPLPARSVAAPVAPVPSSAPSASVAPLPAASEPPAPPSSPAAQKARIVAEFVGRRPRVWGTAIPGVRTAVLSSEPVLALTFDACGGPGGDGYDAALIELLRRERVAATLFLTSKWIAAHRETAASLAADPLFEIENHGSAHRPCSVTGRSAYDIRGTRSVGEAVDEIQRGAAAIAELTGRSPRFYRPGTAYFDDVCLDVAAALGQIAAGFAVNGDGGAGFTRAQVKDALVKARPGSILLLHMNRPSGRTAEGVMDALPLLRGRGVKLVKLADVLPK